MPKPTSCGRASTTWATRRSAVVSCGPASRTRSSTSISDTARDSSGRGTARVPGPRSARPFRPRPESGRRSLRRDTGPVQLPRRRRARSPATTSPAPTRRCSRRSPGPTTATPRPTATTVDERVRGPLPGPVRATSRPCSRSTAPAPTCWPWRPCSGPAEAVVCTEWAHIAVDETGRARAHPRRQADRPPERPTPSSRPAQVEAQAHLIGNPHHAQPGVVSITQSTELGTLYTADEVAALCDAAHRLGMTRAHGRGPHRQRHRRPRRRRRRRCGR